VRHFPTPEGRVIADVFGNSLLEIIHVRNNVIAFSLGLGLPEALRPLLCIVLPLVVLAVLVLYYCRAETWTALQRWSIAGIVGGGLGNIIDRIIPPGGITGVVDFISVKFYGIFGLERWPTFNIADASVVICVLLWLVTIILPGRHEDKT
jgi:signal peptidase II